MQTSLNILICFLILYFNFVRLNASELIVSLPEIQIEGIPAMNPCKNDSDCQGVKDAVCIDDYCSCNGSKFCPNILEFKVTKLGEQCRQSSNCHIEHSVCLNRICECVTGMVPSLNKKECLEESSRNCTKLGNCSQSTAINCPRGFVRNAESTKCLRVPQIFQSSCREDAQCSEQFGNAVCINATTCQCQPSYQYDNISEKCISLEINCREDKDCLDSEQEEDANLFSCVMGVCKPCFEDEELCKNRPETGPCLDHSCNGSSANVESRTCNTGRCECPEERQFCVNNADSDGVRFRGHPIHKHISTRKPRILRPFTKVKNANKWPHNLLKKHRIASGLDTQDTEQPENEVPTQPMYWFENRSLVTIICSFVVHSLFSTTITVMTVCPRSISHLYATYIYPINVVIVLNCLFFSLRVDEYISEINVIIFITSVVVLGLLGVRKTYGLLISCIIQPKRPESPRQYSRIPTELYTSDESLVVDESETKDEVKTDATVLSESKSKDELKNEPSEESVTVQLKKCVNVNQPNVVKKKSVGQGRGRAGRHRRT